MKKNLIGISICMLLIAAAVLPVAGTENFNTTKLENHFLGATEQGSTASNGDWWPMFRHDPGNTGCSSSIAPNTNRLCWEQNIGEEIYTAAPIVVEDRLYISTESFYKDIGPLFMPNGTKLSIPEKPPDLSEILEVIMAQKEDYFGGVHCLDADDGTPLWNYSMYSPNDPAVVDGKVYVTDIDFYSYYYISSSVYCLDAATGNKIWEKPLDYIVLTPTIVADDKIYLGALDLYSYSGTFLCLDLNGDIIWTHPMPYGEVMFFTTPAVCEGKVCFLTMNLYSYFTGTLYCLNAETGVELWTKTIFSYPFFFGSRSPVCSNGKVYVSDMDIYSYNGQLYCYDLTTGQPEWTYNLGWSFSTPVVCDGSVYITALDFSYYEMSIYRIDAESGLLIWRAPAPGEVYYLFFAGSLISADDKLYLAPFSFYYYGYGQNTLYCLDTDDGSQLWNYTLNDETICSPSIADERLYIGDYYGTIYAFEDELKLKRLAGGFLNVKAFIANDGDASLSNVAWSITVVGGMFGNVTRSGTIPTLNTGILGMKIKRAFPVFGFGNIQVTATVTMPDLNVIKRTKEGFVLGPIVVLLPILG